MKECKLQALHTLYSFKTEVSAFSDSWENWINMLRQARRIMSLKTIIRETAVIVAAPLNITHTLEYTAVQ